MIADPNKKSLIIVESPTKAKTIGKYLPSSCIVKASTGHVVDLNPSPSSKKGGLYGVDVDHGFLLDYCVVEGKEKILGELKKDLKKVDQLILASDEDREGESIAWHLLNQLDPKVPVYRMVFHEITKKAITEAFSSCRDIDMNLVRAQEARRAVDRLQGYGISPILSQKLGSKYSAGRVQSPALKLIVEREKQRRLFTVSQYSSVEAEMEKDGKSFSAVLTHIGGKSVATGKSFDGETGEKKGDVIVLGTDDAERISQEITGKTATVESVQEIERVEKPSWPFTTSTLQMDATRKLGKSAKDVMAIAQRLYENGFITYMRTDSPTLSQECINAAADYIRNTFGDSWLTVRQYKAKTLGAQEAHEAIRPAGDHFRTPEETGLKGDELKLYTLIWKRTIASQMKDSVKAVTKVEMSLGDYRFSSSGSVVKYEGFRRVYMAAQDSAEEKSQMLPSLKTGDEAAVLKGEGKEHSTLPPQRYTEASLVQKLESEEIGRPSTYASIISTLLDRGYVVRQSSALVPTFTGFFVNAFLEKAFPLYIGYDFTKEMEAGLDRIATGDKNKEDYLSSFWFGNGSDEPGLSNDLSSARGKMKAGEAKSLALPGLEYSFDHNGEKVSYEIKTGKFGPYILSSLKDSEGKDVMKSIPPTLLPGSFSDSDAERLLFPGEEEGTDLFGEYSLKKGRWGDYIERKSDGAKVSWPKSKGSPLSAEKALLDLMFTLPKELGTDEEGNKVELKVGPYGFYAAWNGKNVKVSDPLSVTLESIVSPKEEEGIKGVLDDLPIEVKKGRYGAYIKWGEKNIPLPKEEKKDPSSLTLERVCEIALSSSAAPANAGGREFVLADGTKAYLVEGKYGAYIKWEGENVALSKEKKENVESVDLTAVEEAVAAHKAKPKSEKKTRRYTKK
ncbi:MAG: type I DNA topoisomerase [Candidatus Ornithospirochaeta sp.]